jgi:sulfide dehydrogenase [flavocytochrome c] flavoprotein subunit
VSGRRETFESTLVANVHVIGDACIAGAMPKSASAAHSQACTARARSPRRCAGRNCRQRNSKAFATACWRDRALAIHAASMLPMARFAKSTCSGCATANNAQAQAQTGSQWYDTIVAESFGS